MARFLSKLSSSVTTFRYWLRSGGHINEHASWPFGDCSTDDMDFFDIGLRDGDAPYLHSQISCKEPRVG